MNKTSMVNERGDILIVLPNSRGPRTHFVNVLRERL